MEIHLTLVAPAALAGAAQAGARERQAKGFPVAGAAPILVAAVAVLAGLGLPVTLGLLAVQGGRLPLRLLPALRYHALEEGAAVPHTLTHLLLAAAAVQETEVRRLWQLQRLRLTLEAVVVVLVPQGIIQVNLVVLAWSLSQPQPLRLQPLDRLPLRQVGAGRSTRSPPPARLLGKARHGSFCKSD